jgi:MYXO-CTERM domain-containing protein
MQNETFLRFTGAVVFVVGCSADHASLSATSASLTQSAEATASVQRARNLFARAPAQGPARTLSPVLPASFIDRADFVAGLVHPHLTSTTTSASVAVTLPGQFGQPFHIESDQGMALDVSLAGSASVPAEFAGGFIVYRAALGSTVDVIQGAMPWGTEDNLVFASAPSATSVDYRVTLGARVAGLRLVSNTLEFVDGAGTPRLRMSPPYLMDSKGHRFDAMVSVTDCHADTNPSAPWDRAVTPAGAGACTVHIDWSESPISYPAVLDPTWMSTGTMSTGRAFHTLTLLTNGQVLAAGGTDPVGDVFMSAELFNPTSGAWAATGSMGSARYSHTATLLSTTSAAQVLVAGGNNGSTSINGSELYSPASGMWTASGNMVTARDTFTATLLSGGKVLVAAGSSSGTVTGAAEIFNPAGTGTWTSTGALTTARSGHTASLLASGKVLVAGGADSSNASTNTVEIFDPIASAGVGAWSSAANLNTGRQNHITATLASGKVLVAGGQGLAGLVGLASSELYDPTSNAWTFTGTMTTARTEFTGTVLNSGKVLVAGGNNGLSGGVTVLTSAELYDPIAGNWTLKSPLNVARQDDAAALLANGQVLVSGGEGTGVTFTSLNSSEIYTLGVNTTLPDSGTVASTCATGDDCATGFCEDGYCCNTACSGPCDFCNLPGSQGICTIAPAGTPSSGGTCNPFLCNGTSATCPSSCSPTALSCVPTEYCNASNQCVALLATGQVCTVSADCVSGFCVDGVCCSTECTSQCGACNVTGSYGTCTPVAKGTPPTNGRPPCANDGTSCGGTCDGTDLTCNYPSTKTSCHPASCVGNVAVGASLCSGSGACVAGTLTSCAPYGCSGTTCLTTCSADTDCDNGYHCADGTCAVGAPNGNGLGNGPDSGVTPINTSSGGCSCQTSGSPEIGLLLAGLATLFNRRRSRRAI